MEVSARASDSPRLLLLSQQAPNAASWAVAPLEHMISPEIRPNLTFLREDLLDEGKERPEAELVTYRHGYQLCGSIIAALDERDDFVARAGLTIAKTAADSKITSQSLDSRRNYMMSWPQYKRETDQRVELLRQATNNTAVEREKSKLEWTQRASSLRREIDAQYAAFRNSLRMTGIAAKSGPPTDTALPAKPTIGVAKKEADPNSNWVNLSPPVFTNSLGMKFVLVPEANVLFCIHETRNSDYAVFAKQTSSAEMQWQDRAGDGKEQYPVVLVDWDDAHGFCEWLSKKESRHYRLPTDREWSVAVGIGQSEDPSASPEALDGRIQSVFPWGNSWPPPPNSGNFREIPGYADNWAASAPVMSSKPNILGIFDMEGNVAEWCENTCAKPDAIEWILRGGTWKTRSPSSLLSANRAFTRQKKLDDIGFRCVLVQ